MSATRRGLIAGGTSALAMGAFMPSPAVAALQVDRDLIDVLFAQEQAQIAFYTAILDTFDASAFGAAGLPEGTRTGIEAILAAERAHITIVTREDGPQSPAPPAPTLDDLQDALTEAAALENLAVAAYAFVIATIGRERLIPELLGIHSVEARHAAWLATLLGGEPFPAAIDRPLTLDESTGELQEPTADQPMAGTPVAAEGMAPVVAAVAAELGVSPEALQVIAFSPETWPDRSLGCPAPDELYAQVITPGYAIVVDVGGEQIEFHADERGTIVRCP